MLTITRKTQEVIVFLLPDGKVIEIVNLGNRSTRLGIKAPEEVKIHRQEVLQRIALECAGIVGGGEVPLSESPKLD